MSPEAAGQSVGAPDTCYTQHAATKSAHCLSFSTLINYRDIIACCLNFAANILRHPANQHRPFLLLPFSLPRQGMTNRLIFGIYALWMPTGAVLRRLSGHPNARDEGTSMKGKEKQGAPGYPHCP
jgi:hypothetical protein